MKDPRPRMTSARPEEIASIVENRWKTRMGSSELRTVTAEPIRIRCVRAAIAARTMSGADTAKSSLWCSPTPMKSMPTESASTAWSTMFLITWWWGSGVPSASTVTSPNVSSPSSEPVVLGVVTGVVSCAALVMASSSCRRSAAPDDG